MQSNLTPSEMEKAFYRRAADYAGLFFVAVKTTGIFCLPTCPARKPKRENIRFFQNTREALFSGYRPCLRCQPLEAIGKPPSWASSLLQTVAKDPQKILRDGDLRHLKIQPEKARRYFLQHYGLTFHAYQRAMGMGEALKQIRCGKSLDDVALGNGYESHSGFRQAFGKIIGKAPGKSRTQDCIYLSWLETPIGPLILGANSKGVCLVEFTDRRMLENQFRKLAKHFRCPIVPGDNQHLAKLRTELKDYFAGKLKKFTVSLNYPGSEFEKRVWDALLQIPYGKTCSYEELAQKINHPQAPRAVGRANGMNRIGIVIPCHRVINKNGELGGYGGGLRRKQYLLNLERQN